MRRRRATRRTHLYLKSVCNLTERRPGPHIGAASPPSKLGPRTPPTLRRTGGDMECVIARCAGLDVHKATVDMCV